MNDKIVSVERRAELDAAHAILATAPAPSPCDTCPKPGRCCHGFIINLTTGPDETSSSMQERLDAHGLPFFHPIQRARVTQPMNLFSSADYSDSFASWRLWCERLLPNGRCGDYENRPNLCRTFEPGSDRLCVLTQPGIGHP